jgi:hypothetical protein
MISTYHFLEAKKDRTHFQNNFILKDGIILKFNGFNSIWINLTTWYLSSHMPYGRP